MARAGTSFPDEWETLLTARVAALRRPSLSHHIALLLEDDLRSAGVLPTVQQSPLDGFVSKLQATPVEEMAEVLAELEKVLTKVRRVTRRKAA
jgi:hypothetical protein